MKFVNMPFWRAALRRGRTTAVLVLILTPLAASRADNFTTSVPSASTQTWNDAIWQPGSVTATNGNTYEVLRGGGIWSPFPPTGELQNFPGDSLTLDHGSKLIVTGPLRYTLYFPGMNGQPGLILNGGRLRTEQETTDQVYRIVGSVSVTSNSVIQNSSGIGGISIVAQLSGTSGLTFMDGGLTSPLDIESTNNSYSGQWTVMSGYLAGVGDGSLGTGNIIVAAGAAFEVDYDIQTPGALTLTGSNSVMVLHQDCQFSALSINGVSLPLGTYTYNNLLAQFPVNFAAGGSGSITVVPLPSGLASPPPPTSDLPGFYVDYSAGSDSNPGTNAAAPWKHCPGDPAATAVAASTPLSPGDTVFFKGGVQYVLTGNGNAAYQTGIGLNWSGSASNPITYDGNSDGTWGTGRAIFTDNYSVNHIAAFYAYGSVSNLAFNNLEIGPIGGAATLPADPGSAIPSNPGYGIFLNTGAWQGITIANCYLHDLGYWFNQQPMSSTTLEGNGGISSTAIALENGGVVGAGVTITNCEITKVFVGIDLSYSSTMTNVNILGCTLHDYINWGIDLAGLPGGLLDYVAISGNSFTGMAWAYDPQYWTAYGTPPHQDIIFHRTSVPGATNGQHINIYNNQFVATHPYEDPTAYIYMEMAASANIYNNLFDVRNAGVPGGLFADAEGGGPGMPINISYETNLPSVIRILNNTFVINSPSNSANNALEWSTAGSGQLNPGYCWPSSGILQVENNVMYSFSTNTGQSLLLNIYNPTNLVATDSWTVDYNCWFDGPQNYNNWNWWYTGGTSVPGIPNTTRGLAQMQAWGFEAHGTTNTPLFVSCSYDGANNNYTPAPGSVLVGAGANLSDLNLPGLDADIAGNPRTNGWDIGAYQH